MKRIFASFMPPQRSRDAKRLAVCAWSRGWVQACHPNEVSCAAAGEEKKKNFCVLCMQLFQVPRFISLLLSPIVVQ